MSQDASCPYCQAEQSIPVIEDDTSAIYVQCTSCRGVFEFMPDFGSFSLPDQGQGFTPTRRTSGSFSTPEYVISDADRPDDKCGSICCCIIMMATLIFFFDYFLGFLFG